MSIRDHQRICIFGVVFQFLFELHFIIYMDPDCYTSKTLFWGCIYYINFDMCFLDFAIRMTRLMRIKEKQHMETACVYMHLHKRSVFAACQPPPKDMTVQKTGLGSVWRRLIWMGTTVDL